LKRVADLKANVLHIYHERFVRDTPLLFTRVELELETRGLSHVAEIVRDLRRAGYVLDGCEAADQGADPPAIDGTR
jgi:threonine dehydratase